MTIAPKFTLVQVTDLHLTDDDEESRTEPRIFGALKHMNARFRGLLQSEAVRDCDVLLATGDITDTGNERSWRHFWDAINANGLLLKTRVVLGNHDVASLYFFRWRIPRVTRSLARARYRKGLHMGSAPEAYPWHERFFGGEVLIVAMRSSAEANRSNLTNAVGRLSQAQLLKLKRILRKQKDARYKVVTLHHPPCFPEDGSINSFLHDVRADEAKQFLEICLNAGVHLIVHGHMHRFMDQRESTIRIVGAAASTQPVADAPGSIELCRYVFSEGNVMVERILVPHDHNPKSNNTIPRASS